MKPSIDAILKGTHFGWSHKFKNNLYLDSNLVPIKCVRLATLSDAPGCQKLYHKALELFYGKIDDFQQLISTSTYSFVMENFDNAIVAFISCKNYPNIPALLPEVWPEWMAHFYKQDNIIPINSLFIHVLLHDPKYSIKILHPIISELFNTNMKVKVICYVIPPGSIGKYPGNNTFWLDEILSQIHLKLGDALAQLRFQHILPDNERNPQSCQSLLIVSRKFRLKIRTAVVEDNDALVRILDQHCPKLKEFYGEFYIARIISDSRSTRNIFLAQLDNKPIGMLCLNSEVNIDKLEKNFELEIYHGLRKCEDEQSLRSGYEAELSSQASISNACNNNNGNQKSNISSFSSSLKEYNSNVFMIELYGIDTEINGFDINRLLTPAFEAFPNRDICIVMMPIQNERLKVFDDFLLVTRKLNSDFEQDLFLTHKYRTMSDFYLRRATCNDLEQIFKFIETMINQEIKIQLIEEVQEAIFNQENDLIYIFISSIQNSIIGLYILERIIDVDYLKVNFDLEPLIDLKYHRDPNSHCIIKYVIENPIFLIFHIFTLMEISRLCGFTSYFHMLGTSNSDAGVYTGNHNRLKEMFSVRPRKRIQYDFNKIAFTPPKHITQKEPDYALYHLNTQLFLTCKKTITDRIVIAGWDEIALSFLEELIFSIEGQKFWFSDLTIINPFLDQGATDEIDFSYFCDSFKNDGRYNTNKCRQMAFQTWVNTVYGTLTQIHRSTRHVVIDGGNGRGEMRLKYDKLYLLSGNRFDIPSHQYAEIKANNLFIVNNLKKDGSLILARCKKRMQNCSSSIIVYGNNLESYCFLQFLLRKNVPEKLIHFVRPPRKEAEQRIHKSVFNDDFIETEIEKITAQTINYHDGYKMVSWIMDTTGTSIESIQFASYSHMLNLDCNIFVYFDNKSVCHHLQMACKNAGLLKDHKVLINEKCCTIDKNIIAAGPITKYEESVLGYHLDHTKYDRSDVGKTLAKFFIKTISREEPKTEQKTIVSFSKNPKIYSCKIIDRYKYLHVAAPGISRPKCLAKLLNKYGRDIITKNEDGNANCNYFRLHLDQNNTVDEITCLTKNELQVENLSSLYGKNEKLLNNLIDHYDLDAILDLYEYFKEPFLYPIYHDKFSSMNKLKYDDNDDDDCDMENVKRKFLKFLRKYSDELLIFPQHHKNPFDEYDL